MVPLTGSLSDLHSTAQDISSISSISAETATANVNAYAAGETASGRSNSTASTYSSPIHTEGASEESTGKHREEVNGNNVSPVKSHSTDLDLAVSQAESEVKERDMDGKEEDESEGTDGRGQEEGAEEGERDRREMASVWHDGLQESIVILRGPSSNYSQEESFDVDTDSAMVGTPSEVKDFVDDSEMTEDQDVSASAQNEMASSGEGIDGFKSEAQQPDVVAQNEITGDRVGTASGSDREESKGDVEDMPSGSEREETKGDREETASDREDTKGDKEDVASGK
nr:hypothetical protein BaRGS_005233 [Batillaria attramentaria]